MFCYQRSRKENHTTTAESLIDPYYLPQEIKQTQAAHHLLKHTLPTISINPIW